MSAKSTEEGFTLIELIGILILVGVLAAVAVPKFGDLQLFAQAGSRDQVVAALRYAAQTSASHRRLVCATVSSGGVSLQIAAAHPASACSASLDGPAGGAAATLAAGVSAALAPSGVLYFQPNGRITSDAAGVNTGTWTVSLTGESPVTLVGETAFIQ